MKPRSLQFFPRTLVVCFAPLLVCASAHATLLSTNESNTSGVWTLPSGTNLLAGRAPAALAATHESSSTNWNTVVDGTLGDVNGATATSVTPNNGDIVTFPLDVAAQPEGYNITSFDSYCTWGNSGRDNQNFMIVYSTVDNPTVFLKLSTVIIQTAVTAERSTHTQLTDDKGFLAKRVHTVKLVFNRQENGYVGYREFVLRGTPVTACVGNDSRNDIAWPPIVGPNLLNGATAFPAPAQPVHGGDVASNTWTTVTDGILGTADAAGNIQSVTPNNTNTVTFPLDLSGAHSGGYSIASFESYAAWANNGRDDQRYLLEYSTAAAPGVFIPITDVNSHTEFGTGSAAKKSTRTLVAGNGGPIATGVGAIRLTFHDQENGYTGFREFILRETPLPKTIVKEGNATNIWTLPVGTNLLSSATPTPATLPGTHGNTDVTSESWSVLTNGMIPSLATDAYKLASASPADNTSVVFALDTTTNTQGYRLKSFDSYCAWGNADRDDQNYTLSYATVDAPGTFIKVQDIQNYTMPSTPTQALATHTRIQQSSGVLASRVGQIKVDFTPQENGYVGYQEFVALGRPEAFAAALTWKGLTDGSWVTTADSNWADSVGTAPYTSLAPLNFDDTGTNTTINIPTALTADSLTFSNNSVPYSFGGQPLTVTYDVTQSGTGSTTFNNPLTAADVTVSGGSLTLAADNGMTGVTTVNNGTLNLTSYQALGYSSLELTGGTVNFKSALGVINNLAGTGGALVMGNAAGPGNTTVSLDNAVSTVFAGSISDASGSATGSIDKNGSGTLTLSGTNSYSGPTNVYLGELKFSQRLSLYNGNQASWTSTNIRVNTDFGFPTLTLGMGGPGQFTGADVAALNTGGFGIGTILGLDTTSASAVISENLGGNVIMNKLGINTLTLSGTNSFTQGITVVNGALAAANPSGISIPGDLTIGNSTFGSFANMGFNNQFAPASLVKFETGAQDGKLQLRGTSQTVAGLESPAGNDKAIVQNDETGSPGYTTDPGACTLTLDTPAASFHSFKGLIRNQNGGSLSLVKKGTGTQELRNAPIQSYGYNGPTTIEAGTLKINFARTSSGFASNVAISTPATLNLHSSTDGYDFNTVISGVGKLLVTGGMPVALTNGNNSWTGGTTVDGGFLALKFTNTVGDGNGPNQNCVAGAMDPSNVINLVNGGILSLDNAAALGSSAVLPQYAPTILVNEGCKIFGGTNTVAFVSNITLNGGKIEITDGVPVAAFNTNLTFVGTVIVGGSSTVPAEIFTNATATGPYATASLGSVGLPGTIFQVADVTSSPDPDLTVSSILQNVHDIVSPLVKTGSGTMLLSGANIYTGDTTVTDGQLTVSGNSIPDTNKVVLNGGKLGLLADETVATLYYGGIQQVAGTYGSTSSAATHQDNSRFTGTGILTVTTEPVADPYLAWSSAIPNVNDRDRTDDPDGDGFNNLQEFLFGTSPIASTGSLSTIQDTGSGLIVRWNQRATGTSTYALEESTTLVNPWSPSGAAVTDDLVSPPITDYVRKQATIPVDSAKKFVRVFATE